MRLVERLARGEGLSGGVEQRLFDRIARFKPDGAEDTAKSGHQIGCPAVAGAVIGRLSGPRVLHGSPEVDEGLGVAVAVLMANGEREAGCRRWRGRAVFYLLDQFGERYKGEVKVPVNQWATTTTAKIWW